MAAAFDKHVNSICFELNHPSLKSLPGRTETRESKIKLSLDCSRSPQQKCLVVLCYGSASFMSLKYSNVRQMCGGKLLSSAVLTICYLEGS